jgi:signal transduction histidine kinase
MPSSNEKPPPESIDARFIAMTRCVLAIAVSVILTFDPLTRARFSEVSYLLLVLYVTYSVILYMTARWWRPILPSIVEPWLDVGWAVGLVAFNSDPSGLLFGFAFFPLLVAAFQWGLRLGGRIALGLAFLFACIGAILTFVRSDFEFRHVLVGLIPLAMLGYLTAALGGRELTLRGRLAFIKDVSRLSNPRFGVDRTIGMFMERLRAFHDADGCTLIMADQGASSHHLRRVDRGDPTRGEHAEPLPEDMARLLLPLPAEHAVLHYGAAGVPRWWQQRTKGYTYDVMRQQRVEGNEQVIELLATTLEAEAFVSVPLHYQRQAIGRLYLIGRKAFDPSDVEFLLEVIEPTMTAIHHIRLVDQLASDAAQMERRRIAHDLHDSVIQPYIWLCIGLQGIEHKLATGSTDVIGDVQRLLDLTNNEIDELRRYTRSLRAQNEPVGAFLPAVRRFADKFSEITGLPVEIEASEELCLNEQLAAEAFQMVTEGLSNILRHTQATRACITLARCNDHFTLQIANDGPAPVSFTPHSLTERASALGGHVRVEREGGASTVVVIEIPL